MEEHALEYIWFASVDTPEYEFESLPSIYEQSPVHTPFNVSSVTQLIRASGVKKWNVDTLNLVRSIIVKHALRLMDLAMISRDERGASIVNGADAKFAVRSSTRSSVSPVQKDTGSGDCKWFNSKSISTLVSTATGAPVSAKMVPHVRELVCKVAREREQLSRLACNSRARVILQPQDLETIRVFLNGNPRVL